MSQKILLVSSSFEDVSLMLASNYQPTGVKTTEASHYPLGMAYLHAYLESQGHEVRSLFLNNYSENDCFKIISQTVAGFLPQIVGFQILTPNRVSTYHLIDYLHKKYPGIHLVGGGIHATIMYRQLIEKFPFLVIVLGEGEITFAQLLRELTSPKPDLRKVDGIAFWYKNSVVTTKPRQLIANLDELPFPAHEVFFNDNTGRTSGCLITSRGCPFGCSFCCLESISRRKVRLRSPKNVVDEIEMMVRKFPQIKRIWIHDDNFFIDNQRVIEICDEIIRRQIKTRFICSARVKPISQEMIRKLEAANFQKVLLGLESGDEGILKSCHKGITRADALNAIKLFSASKILVSVFLIVGLPGENLKTIRETAKFVKTLQKIKYLYISEIALLTVYPGTEVYEIARVGGMIDDDYWLSDQPTPVFTLENNLEQLFRFKKFLLSHVSLDSFLTPAGLARQLTVAPKIIKYMRDNKGALKGMVSRSLKTILPAQLFESAKKIYHLVER